LLKVSWKWDGSYFNCHFSIQHALRPAQTLQQTSPSRHQQLISQTHQAAQRSSQPPLKCQNIQLTNGLKNSPILISGNTNYQKPRLHSSVHDLEVFRKTFKVVAHWNTHPTSLNAFQKPLTENPMQHRKGSVSTPSHTSTAEVCHHFHFLVLSWQWLNQY